MKILSTIIVILAILLIHWMQTSYTNAMNTCQEKHSYDTCFWTFNR